MSKSEKKAIVALTLVKVIVLYVRIQNKSFVSEDKKDIWEQLFNNIIGAYKNDMTSSVKPNESNLFKNKIDALLDFVDKATETMCDTNDLDTNFVMGLIIYISDNFLSHLKSENKIQHWINLRNYAQKHITDYDNIKEKHYYLFGNIMRKCEDGF